MSKHTPGHLCNVCFKQYPRGTGCTNRLCDACHARFCIGSGITSPGHGIDIDKARAAIAKATA